MCIFIEIFTINSFSCLIPDYPSVSIFSSDSFFFPKVYIKTFLSFLLFASLKVSQFYAHF